VSVLALLDPAALRARVTGRSWWVVRYRDGRTINEWDGPDWSLLPRSSMAAVRLYCPNGQVAELGNSVDASDRLFQLKVGVMASGAGKRTEAHIIGIVNGTNGECQCAAWQYGDGRLVTFMDNVFTMQYQNIGQLSADVLGIKPD
jgi:hypothetical protein